MAGTVRGLYLTIAAVFALFLPLSAPHRVHHFFERLPAASHSASAAQAHDHAGSAETSDTNQHKRTTSEPTDCFVLSITQNSHVTGVQTFAFVAIERPFAGQSDQAITQTASFDPSPFSQRAPPRTNPPVTVS